jgi:hypothetical protein
MMKLMKYELLRRKQLLIGALLAILVLEGITVYAIYRGGNWNVLATILTFLLVIGTMLLPILNTVTKLYADYKQKQGYMLFLTPQSGYKILWSKTLYGAIEILAAIALVAGCLFLSGYAANQFQDNSISNMLMSMQNEMGNLSLNSFGFIYVLLILLQLLAQLSIAMLAVTVSRSIMPATNYGWLIALLMYFAFVIGVNLVDSVLLLAFGLAGDIMNIVKSGIENVGSMIAKYLTIGVVTYVAWFVGCTALAGRLASKNVDL